MQQYCNINARIGVQLKILKAFMLVCQHVILQDMYQCGFFGAVMMTSEDWTAVYSTSRGPSIASPSAQANFSKEDFHSVDIAFEIWFTRSTIFALDFPGAVRGLEPSSSF